MLEILHLGHFFFINDESPIDGKVPQVMCYILCYNKLVGHVVFEQKIRLRKDFVSYFTNNGMIVLQKHVDANHGLIAKNF
jgi:hypothetical protein